MIPFGTFCSGIGAPEIAAQGLPFEPVFCSEIEPYPSAVLARHFPSVPNLGDFTKIGAEWLDRTRILVAGTPCQAFSIAGLRNSLDDDRGNLTLEFVKKVHAARNLFCALWENVPGVLSTTDNAFGCFLSALVGADAALRSPLERGRWPDAGMVSGPKGGAAWRILDAQYFGVPQRRRRVFLVFCPAASGGDPAAILFEPKGLSRDFEASGEAGQDVAGTLSARTEGGGGLGADFEIGGGLQPCRAPDMDLRSLPRGELGERRGGGDLRMVRCAGTEELGTSLAFGGNNTAGAIDVATCLSSHGGPHGRQDFASETFVCAPIAPALTRNPYGDNESREGLLVANTLKAEGFDASEDGTGRTNLVPIAFDCKASGRNGFGVGETMSTLRSMSHSNSHQNGGGHAAVAMNYGVRRLLPVECERLQGFPDNHTDLRRNRPVDGPRYKGCGNSMAVPNIRWLWGRILADMVRCGAAPASLSTLQGFSDHA